jgi:hypothetical protein
MFGQSQEMMQSVAQERQREAARLLRQHQAERSARPAATPRSGRSPQDRRKHPLSVLAARIRAASVL